MHYYYHFTAAAWDESTCLSGQLVTPANWFDGRDPTRLEFSGSVNLSQFVLLLHCDIDGLPSDRVKTGTKRYS